MSAEAEALFLFAALILFGVGAVVAFMSHRVWEGLTSVALACWVLVPFWHALDAI